MGDVHKVATFSQKVLNRFLMIRHSVKMESQIPFNQDETERCRYAVSVEEHPGTLDRIRGGAYRGKNFESMTPESLKRVRGAGCRPAGYFAWGRCPVLPGAVSPRGK
jgi:hypothetical protein